MGRYYRDEWPTMANGAAYDGKRLLQLTRAGESPFQGSWDVELLIREIEETLGTEVTDIVAVDKGSNNYGIHLTTSNRSDIIFRLSRSDLNVPGFQGFPIEKQIPEVRFEAAVYDLLKTNPRIKVSRLLYHRLPLQLHEPSVSHPTILVGRALFAFQKAEGVKDVWKSLTPDHKLVLLDDLARIRAALFRYEVPVEISSRYLHDRTFEFKPKALQMAVAPTREFWLHVLDSKIRATIGNIGDRIGWESDNEVVGPIAYTAKASLLKAVPIILPPERPGVPLYRLVLEHGDFGIHNTTISVDADGKPVVTSLFDWETGCIVPALLSDPLVAVSPVDLIAGVDGEPAVTRIPGDATRSDLETYTRWSQHYLKRLYKEAPEYELAIEAGKDLRHLWLALRDWRGQDPEGFFGDLSRWAEEIIDRSNAI